MQIKLSANMLELAVAHHTIFGAKRRAKQIDNSDTKIAITPIAMPVAGLP
jgi:small neutral amino acid transporter SnatA (MarC family)